MPEDKWSDHIVSVHEYQADGAFIIHWVYVIDTRDDILVGQAVELIHCCWKKIVTPSIIDLLSAGILQVLFQLD